MKNLFTLNLGIIFIATSLFFSGCNSKEKVNELANDPSNETEEVFSENFKQEIIATDYNNSENWLSFPDEITHSADVIFFYYTTYMPNDEENSAVCSINNKTMREGAINPLKSQSSAFDDWANVYAPFYRQVNAEILAGMTQPEMVEAESGAPKTDVFAALDYYFENCNDGRPYFLAGHSQGAMMTYIILEEYMKDHPEYYERMIATYMIGNAPTKEWLADNPHIKMAQGADDTGVVVSWNTEGPNNKDQYSMTVPKGSVCINPLNWRTDETPATIEENKGSLILYAPDTYVVAEGFADARIDLERGSVICESVDPDIYAIPKEAAALFGTESYHGWDFEFYYENIRDNIGVRLENYLNK